MLRKSFELSEDEFIELQIELFEEGIQKSRPPHLYTTQHRQCLRYLVKEEKISLFDAINQIISLSKTKVALLHELYSDGLRSQDIEDCFSGLPNILGERNHCMTNEHKQAIVMLVKKHGLTPQKALDEISYLEGLQAKTVSTLYKYNLRKKDFADWRPSFFDSDSRGFSFKEAHKNFVTYLIKEKNFTPSEAIQSTSQLNEWEVELLHTFHAQGLRDHHFRHHYEMLKTNAQGFYYYPTTTEDHKNLINYFVNEKKMHPIDAFNEVDKLSREEALKCMPTSPQKRYKNMLAQMGIFSSLSEEKTTSCSSDNEALAIDRTPINNHLIDESLISRPSARPKLG